METSADTWLGSKQYLHGPESVLPERLDALSYSPGDTARIGLGGFHNGLVWATKVLFGSRKIGQGHELGGL